MNDTSTDLPVCVAILIDGKPLNPTHQINSLSITLHCDEECMATITINESSQATDKIYFPSVLKPNSTLSVNLGYDQQLGKVFHGQLIALEAKVASGVGTLVVLNALADMNFDETSEPPTCLVYGESLLDFNGVTHFEDAKEGQTAFPCEVELTVQGRSELLPGHKITLQHCSQWFDGDYEILAIRHIVENGTWLSQLVVGR